MEQKVNNFVRDVQRLGRARSDFGILKYTANSNEDFYLQIERIENFLTIAYDNLIGFLNSELNESLKNNFFATEVLEKISKAILSIEMMKDDIGLNKSEIIEVLNGCLTSFSDEIFVKVLEDLSQDQEKFCKYKILLQDLCAEHFLD
jgi:hypothetical protein